MQKASTWLLVLGIVIIYGANYLVSKISDKLDKKFLSKEPKNER
jgi:hypothetical protein